MLRHVVMFRFADEAPPEARRAVARGLAELPAAIDEIRGYRFGEDQGLREGNHDFCLVADFADAEAFRRYVDHPAHRRFVRDCLEPAVAERVAVQFELQDEG